MPLLPSWCEYALSRPVKPHPWIIPPMQAVQDECFQIAIPPPFGFFVSSKKRRQAAGPRTARTVGASQAFVRRDPWCCKRMLHAHGPLAVACTCSDLLWGALCCCARILHQSSLACKLRFTVRQLVDTGRIRGNSRCRCRSRATVVLQGVAAGDKLRMPCCACGAETGGAGEREGQYGQYRGSEAFASLRDLSAATRCQQRGARGDAAPTRAAARDRSRSRSCHGVVGRTRASALCRSCRRGETAYSPRA